VVEKLRDVPPPSGFRRWFFRLPLKLYKAGLGRLLGSRFVLLEHIGRVSGKTRRVVLEVVKHERPAGNFYVVAAWGEQADWFQNIKVNPRVAFQVGGQRFTGRAHVLTREEAERVFLEYGRKHPRLLQELMGFVGYRIQRDEASYRDLAGLLPVVRLSSKAEKAG
jgi:deazaflavin-dependent oxidoreductase (nitroreductase family)